MMRQIRLAMFLKLQTQRPVLRRLLLKGSDLQFWLQTRLHAQIAKRAIEQRERNRNCDRDPSHSDPTLEWWLNRMKIRRVSTATF